MATLANNQPRTFEGEGFNELPVIAADIIYEGAAVGDNGSGYARPLVAGDPFRGFAVDPVDNSAGSAGERRVKLRPKGLVQLNVPSVGLGNINDPVYASDDNTFTLTATSNSKIGHVYRYVSTGVCIVAFDVTKGDPS